MSEYVDAVELLRWERKVADAVQVAFREYLPRVEAAALPSLTAGLDPLPPDVGGLAATEDMWRELLRENVMPVMETLMAERVIGRAPTTEGRIGRAKRAVKGFFARLTGKAAKAYELPATREWMGAYLETVENRMVRTPDQVFRKIASEVDQGIAKGEGVRDLRERVQSVLDYSGNSDWPGRAALVARTETTAALNAATLESARLEAKALGIEYEKAWVCVHPDSVVLSDEAAAVARRWYDGPMVTLWTTGNASVTVTPEHKVLTGDRGWVRADEVNETDNLIRVGWGHAAGCPHVENEPSTISEIAGPFLDKSTAGQVWAVAAGVDLHVHGPDGDVEVVPTDGELGDWFMPGASQRSHEVEFMLPDLARDALFRSRARGEGVLAHSPSGKAGAGLGVSGDFGLRGLSGRANLPSGGLVADVGVALAEEPGDGLGGAPEFAGDGRPRHSRLVEAQRVERIEVSPFSGHVYDLQTVGEWFTCNSIIVHNCTIDQRTRDTHFAADGQRRALDAPFKVGAASLLFPGDPSGPVETIANCRCTIVTLEPDEELPSETDRQTERGETNSTVRNRDGSQQDEIDRRADDGVKRARDDDDGDGGVQASARGETMTRTWQGRLAPIGEVSGDARMFKEGGEFSFREFPLPLMHQRTTDEGHDSSVIVGAIRTARAEADGIYGEGVLFDSPDAMEAAALLDEGVVRPSIDWCDQKWELVDRQGAAVDPETITPDMIDDLVFQVTSMTVMAATLVSKPAFEGTSVVLGDDDEAVPDDEEQAMTEVRAALTAAGGGAPVFPASMFADPGLDRVTGIHVTGEGRVVGHVATWGECHVGIQNACVMAPRSKTGYAMFHVSEVDTDEGPLAVGRLTVGAGHADPKLGVTPAREHYDNAASCWAMGRCYEDDYGIAFSGVVHPNASSRQIMDGTSAPLSGDWRRHGGNLELVAALTVNTPGYPVVRGANDEQGRDLSLVAAGMVPASAGDTPPVEQVAAAAARAAVDEYVDRQERDRRANSIGERLSAESRDRLGRIAERRIEVDA